MFPPPAKFFSRLLAVLAGAGLLAGCAHYTLGSTGKLDFQSLYVAPVSSKAIVPQAVEPVSNQLRETLLQEGLRLASQADADATLEVVLTDYTTGVAATQQGNSLNAQSYSVTLTATCKLVDNRNGKVYFQNRPISVTEEAFVQSGVSFSESEYQSVAKLSRDLAVKIKDAVVTAW